MVDSWSPNKLLNECYHLCLQIFEFRDPQVLLFAHTPQIIRRFMLPHLMLNEYHYVSIMEIHLNPLYLSQVHKQEKFVALNTCILVITMKISPVVVRIDKPCMLFIHLSTLPDGLPSVDLVVSWNAWGPTIAFYNVFARSMGLVYRERNGVIPMQTELLLLSNKLARLLVRQNFSRLDCSIHVVVSTYTSMSITKGFWLFTDQKIIPMGL